MLMIWFGVNVTHFWYASIFRSMMCDRKFMIQVNSGNLHATQMVVWTSNQNEWNPSLIIFSSMGCFLDLIPPISACMHEYGVAIYMATEYVSVEMSARSCQQVNVYNVDGWKTCECQLYDIMGSSKVAGHDAQRNVDSSQITYEGK